MLWRPNPPAGFIELCLPTLGQTVPSGPQWVHEIKHDGYRFICRRDGGRVRVYSRRGGAGLQANTIYIAVGRKL